MFTGIVERTGKVEALTTDSHQITRLVVYAGENFPTSLGDSVAVNGCCLTVTSNSENKLSFDLSSETLALTALGNLQVQTSLNLERALKIGDHLGGHIVSGHIDGKGKVLDITKSPYGWTIKISLSPLLGKYCIPKGSICLDGVSLTINSVEDFKEEVVLGLCLIPTTIDVTTFKFLSKGQELNIEVDCIGKYIERLTKAHL